MFIIRMIQAGIDREKNEHVELDVVDRHFNNIIDADVNIDNIVGGGMEDNILSKNIGNNENDIFKDTVVEIIDDIIDDNIGND